MLPMKNQSFYTVLSEYYDEIFPWDEDINRFLTSELSQCNEIIDLACGTGTYSCSLAEQGHTVEGIDLDPEMIRQAKSKAEDFKSKARSNVGGNVSFFQGSMTEPEKFINRRINAAFCIGNSLPHLSDREEVASMLNRIHKLILKNGVFIVQIINFDNFKGKKSADLPTLNAENVSFFRSYSRITEVKVDFDTKVRLKSAGTEFHHSVSLLCLKKNELEELLLKAGFQNVEFYGSYSGEPYTPGSFLTIACANA